MNFSKKQNQFNARIFEIVINDFDMFLFDMQNLIVAQQTQKSNSINQLHHDSLLDFNLNLSFILVNIESL